MPPKKAAGKPEHLTPKHAKKHAPKDEKKHDKHHGQKDLRRAYEHLGRVHLLGPRTEAAGKDVGVLVRLAQEEVHKGSAKGAAELLRAAEHLSFADAAGEASNTAKISDELVAVITEEFEHLREKAKEHWEGESHHPSTVAIYKRALTNAAKALEAGKYHQALELVRAAESLAHAKGPKKPGKEKLKSGTERPQLPGS